MRYLMLVRVPEDADPTPEEADPGVWYDEAVRRGQHLRGERLRPAAQATTVTAWDGTQAVTHGPFTEAAEQIVGFDLLEVANAEEAVALAAGHPVARFGALELRELWPHEGRDAAWRPVDDAALRPVDGAAAAAGDGAPDRTSDGETIAGECTHLLLMASVPSAPSALTEVAGDVVDATTADWVSEMGRRDVDRGGAPLRPAQEAITVRVRDGRTVATHGPFAELAEQVGGYQLIDVADLDEAVAVAVTHPAARHGAIEVRPLWPF